MGDKSPKAKNRNQNQQAAKKKKKKDQLDDKQSGSRPTTKDGAR